MEGRRCVPNLGKHLNQSQSGIYIDTGLGSAANTVIPALPRKGRNPGNIAECTFLDTGLRRCDEGFSSFGLHQLTHGYEFIYL